MRALRWIAACWPGLLQAWVVGCPRAVVLAIAFALALNSAVLATFVWPAWPRGLPAGCGAAVGWVLVLGLWAYGILRLRHDWPRVMPVTKSDPQLDDSFREAQQAYLRGHWPEAEALVTNILQRRPNDVESRLLMASIERRTNRYGPARQTLAALAENAAAGRWQWEIAAELEQITEEMKAENEGIAKAA